jgi:2-polyprenyl-6-methoxyphenol hydroxylase-like FAD-dependent oxidoreductase
MQAAVVIGADGAWSRIRPLLSSARPQYTGFSFLDVTVTHASARHPHLSQLVGPGTAVLLDDQRGLLAQMNGNDTLRTYAALKVPEGWAEDEDGGAFLAAANREAIDRLIALYFSGWHEAALDLLRRADARLLTVHRIYALPADHRFTHREQSRLLTAVGDAAHLMSPFAGEGRQRHDRLHSSRSPCPAPSPRARRPPAPSCCNSWAQPSASASAACSSGRRRRQRRRLPTSSSSSQKAPL